MEKEKTKWLGKALFVLMMILLFIPIIQQALRGKKVMPLKGAVVEVEKRPFVSSAWLDGDYQAHMENYINQEFGYRNYLLRLDNQLEYSLYGTTKANNVTIGKEGYIYEQNYIDAYTGKDFLGENPIIEKVSRLKSIQDTLQALGKDLVVILAAGKASYYPEYIPDKFGGAGDRTNYHVFAEQLDSQGLNHIDFNSWFISCKGKEEYPYYPKTGIHWSRYAMSVVADSLVRYVEGLKGWDLADITIGDVEMSDRLKEGDTDLEDGMNLLFKIPNFTLAYPKTEINNQGKKKPKSIMIADSFYWGIYSLGMSSKVFDNGKFWYYYYEVYPEQFVEPTSVLDIDIKQEILEKDIVILMATEGNLSKFPWGFEQDVYELFYNPEALEERRREKELQTIINRMKADENWMDALRQKAMELGEPLDSIMRRDAVWLAGQ